jgi:hypothetical protein
MPHDACARFSAVSGKQYIIDLGSGRRSLHITAAVLQQGRKALAVETSMQTLCVQQ